MQSSQASLNANDVASASHAFPPLPLGPNPGVTVTSEQGIQETTRDLLLAHDGQWREDSKVSILTPELTCVTLCRAVASLLLLRHSVYRKEKKKKK